MVRVFFKDLKLRTCLWEPAVHTQVCRYAGRAIQELWFMVPDPLL